MAERVSFIPEVEDESDDDFSLEGSRSKKKSKKSAEKIGAALIDKTEVPKRDNPLENFRGIFAEKPEKITEKASAETALKKLSDEALETTPLTEWRELRPDELAGGEVVIELHETEEPAESSEVEEVMGSDAAELIDEAKDEEDDPPALPSAGAGAGGGSGSGSGRSGPSGAAHGSSGASGGGVPPLPPISSSSYPPTPRRRATSTASRTFTSPPVAPGGASFNQLLAVQQAADEAWHRGRGRGRGEGLLAGLIVGGGIEHFRHKSREKKMDKKAKTEKQKLEKTFESERTELTHKATKDRLEYEQKLHAEADAAIVAQTSEASATTKALAAEKAKVDAEKEKAKLIERLNAQAAEQERLDAEELLKDPEHRIETSAWHAMEVDKSGHIVQDSSLEYGHEYYRERAHETGPKDQLDAKAGSAAVAAAMLSGSSASQSVPAQMGSQQAQSTAPAMTPTQKNALPPIMGIDPENDSDSSSHVSAIAIVPWLIVLAVVAIAIIALL